MLQSIGALKSAIVVLSKHHSSLAQVRVFFGDSGTRARSLGLFLRIRNCRFRASAKKRPTRRSTRAVDLCMLLSQDVFANRFTGALLYVWFLRSHDVSIFFGRWQV